MKTLISLLLVVSVCLSPIAVNAGSEWYENGSLHRSNLKQWKNATYANKLATAADMSLASPKVKAYVNKSGSVDTLRPFAVELVTCINEASAGQGSDSMKVAEMAASCMILMGWK